MVIEVSFRQELKAHPPIVVTVEGIVYDVPAFFGGYAQSVDLSLLNNIPSMDMYFGLSALTSIDLRREHPENAPSPIKVTELGIVIVSMWSQPENAPSPIVSTESGMFISLTEQLWNAFFPIDLTDGGIDIAVMFLHS